MSASGSRNQSLAVSRTRLTAKNVIGAGILFKEFAKENNLDNSYFQIFVDCAAVNYRAEVKGFVQKATESNIIYECPKDSYRIQEASYRKITTLKELFENYYNIRKDSHSAGKLYSYGDISLQNSINFIHDFLSGKAQISETYSRLQSYNNRFDEALYSDDNPTLDDLTADAAECMVMDKPFRTNCAIELVTSAKVEDKKTYYELWKTSLSKDVLAERVLLFCTEKCGVPLPKENILTTDIILAYPGAISPFALCAGLDADYSKAANLYSKSKFEEAATYLEESINLNGIIDKNLCLLGASLRLSGKPEKALPYLILCSYLNPKTEYLTGNIILCLSALKFKYLDDVLSQLRNCDIDSWSQQQIESLK
jgi:tetratricopeptide (TPR) repeat protein